MLLRQLRMQSRAKGMYVATYQMYAGICTIKHSSTSSRLSNSTADTIVIIRADMKMIEVIRRSLSAMF